MALTATEETLLRNLLAKQAQLIALANNETTITAKLSSTKATIDDLTAATTVAGADLMIVRQGGVDKKLPVSVVKSDLVDLSSYAPLASPALTGTPTAPTATAGTNTTQLATTAFVKAEAAAVAKAEATQAEMEAGTESSVRNMSPLRVAQAIAAKSSGGIRGQVFTSSGTFTVPDGVTAVKVRGCGGGGSGHTDPGSTHGGTTSFGSYCSATGGKRGYDGGTGGVASGGDININGGVRTTTSGGLCGGTGLFGGASTSFPAAGYGNGGVSASNSGGGGGYFERYITGLTPSSTIAVTIGAGGWGGASGPSGTPGICIVEW